MKTLYWKNGDGTVSGGAREIDGVLCLIDQTLLPETLEILECGDVETVREAIQVLRVRGAPAIGCAAAYGVCVGLRTLADDASPEKIAERMDFVIDRLATSRPTAVNLFVMLDRMRAVYERNRLLSAPELCRTLLKEAHAIFEEDQQMCRAIGRHGAELLHAGTGVLTHCNAGALATSDYGTALAVFYAAVESGKKIHVFADETRPLLQGARLTAWELREHGVPVTLICDNMAAQVMREGRVHAAVVGADRIAANGDAANKIGTYGVAILARYHGIPFYVAAPSSTFDLTIQSGAEIPIEQRSAAEITHGFGRRTAPDGIGVYNPAFDVTPAELITGIITERGIISPVTESEVRRMMGS
jgi:S-methyl-5-thioribose-1-phosphate isomerase